MPNLPILAVLLALVVFVCGDSRGQEAQSGFPLEDDFAWLAPTAIDLDGDGDLELLTALIDEVCVYEHDAEALTTWPASVSGSGTVLSQVVAGDLDGDGTPEVVFTGAVAPQWYAVSNSGEVLEGWPIESPEGYIANHRFYLLADLDGDGDEEFIVAGGTSSPSNRLLHAYDGDGSIVEGWPVDIAIEDVPGQPDWEGLAVESLSAGDVDFDGDDEICVGFTSSANGNVIDAPATLINGDGTFVDGWPVMLPAGGERSSFAFVSFADLDLDGSAELIGHNRSGEVFVVDSGGNLVAPLIPAAGIVFEPSFGNFDDDEEPEMVLSGLQLQIIDFEWDAEEGEFTYEVLSCSDEDGHARYGPVSVADTDGDGVAEMFTYSVELDDEPGQHYYHLYDSEFEELEDWPIDVTQVVHQFRKAGHILADLDNDNDIEVVYVDGGLGDPYSLVVWDIENPSDDPVRVDWSMRKRDARRSTSYHAENYPQRFLRGDADASGELGILDAWSMLNSIFLESEIDCLDRLDFDGSGTVGVVDPLLLLTHLFLSGDAPPAPYPECDRGWQETISVPDCAVAECLD